MNGPIPPSWAPLLQSVLRIVAALSFITHGTQKLLVFPVAKPGNAVALISEMGVAGVLELFGGALMLLGLFTRPVAFVLAGEMAYAYFKYHAPRSFWPILNGGELSALYCFLWFFFAAAGAGPLSLDALIGRARAGRRR